MGKVGFPTPFPGLEFLLAISATPAPPITLMMSLEWFSQRLIVAWPSPCTQWPEDEDTDEDDCEANFHHCGVLRTYE